MKNISNLQLVLLGLAFWSIALYCSSSYDYSNVSDADILPGGHYVVHRSRFWIGVIFEYLIYAQLILTGIRLVAKKHNLYPDEAMARFNVFIFMGAIFIGCTYLWKLIIHYKNGHLQEEMAFYTRVFNGNWWWYFTLMSLPILVSLLFWSKKIRQSITWTISICLLANIGSILEQIIVFLHWIGLV